jgi:peptidoglycan/xylan/chitin deacetylase (PgdA/CDA1 family)
MSWRTPLGAVRRRFLSAACQRRAVLRSATPFVSFTFDDFPRNALTTGGEILKAQGARGTYYAAIGLMGANTEVGEHFRRDDLENLLRDGHELGSHTFSHVSSRRMPATPFRDEVLKGQLAIDDLTGHGGPRSFAFPFGDVTMEAKRAIAGDVASSRGIWRGFNGPMLDLNLLRACPLYGGRAAFPQIRELILENMRRKTWLIFYTHDVTAKPSLYGCTPELLELAVAWAAQYGAVGTVSDVVTQAVPEAAENLALA